MNKTKPTKLPLSHYLPRELRSRGKEQSDIPELAKDPEALKLIQETIQQIPTHHDLYVADARKFDLEPNSVHLVLTSPPY